MRRSSSLALVLLVTLAACGSSTDVRTAAASRDVSPYRGLGTWVDAYDYAAAYQDPGQKPAVTPSSLRDMARLGVRTVFLQASKDDPRSPGMLVDRSLVGQFLVEAHRRGIEVVAWYLPKLADVDGDLRRLRAMHDFRASGQRFDGLAVDIEWIQDVPDVPTRNDRLVDLSRRLRASVGDVALGAIVLPPAQLEVVNPVLWPAFPWRRLRDLYDVWMPMDYWTLRTKESGYRDAFRYVDENTRRLRANLGRRAALVHVIGGIGDLATRVDYDGLHRAVQADDAIGWSVYDFNTTASSAWPQLRAVGAG